MSAACRLDFINKDKDKIRLTIITAYFCLIFQNTAPFAHITTYFETEIKFS
jgi:hypothetical protein